MMALVPALVLGALLMAIHPLIAHHYLLFHSFVEIFAATVSFSTFLFAWNTRRFQNGFLLVVGSAALFVGLFEALHLLAFPGMSVFVNYDNNLSPQLWLSARTFQAAAAVGGLLAYRRRTSAGWLLGGLAAGFAAVCAAVFLRDVPAAVARPAGLTPFKVGVEWTLVAAFVAALGLLTRVRDRFSPRVFRYMVANFVAMAACEVCFTLYSRPYDAINFLGHVLLACAVYWQYQAILETGLTAPSEAHFRDLMQAREESDRAKARLREANESLIAADRHKSDFLALLSHELRNPLAPMTSAIWVLEQAPDSVHARHAREVLGRQIQHLTRLVDDLLDMTRISRGKIRLQRERLDLGALLSRVAEDHRSLFSKAGVVFDVRVDAQAVCVDGDPTRLAQAVGNLLNNAAKFTPRGGQATLSLALEDAGIATIRVTDTGVGIRSEVAARLFEPFVQAENTLDRSVGGLGLGLALVKGLVELHGGSIGIQSEGPGTGAAFVVRLPIVDAPAGVGAAPYAPKMDRLPLQ